MALKNMKMILSNIIVMNIVKSIVISLFYADFLQKVMIAN